MAAAAEKMNKMVCEGTPQHGLVIFSRSSDVMSHSIKTLFYELGTNPKLYELDEIEGGREIEQGLSQLRGNPAVPTVYIGGELVGGANEVITLHLNNSLTPMLRRAGAL